MYRERVNEKLPTEYLLHEFDELIYGYPVSQTA